MDGKKDEVISKRALWVGYVLSGAAVLFFLVDGVMKLLKPAVVVEATTQLGYPVSDIVAIGMILLACTVLYSVSRTSILGAILLTGYLGGAVASQVRAGNGWFNMIFKILLGGLVWGGLWLRDYRVRAVLL